MSNPDLRAESVSLIDEIIRQADVTFERLPMLDIIGRRLGENLSVAFSDLSRCPCDTVFTSLDYAPMAEVMGGFPERVLFAVGTGQPFDGDILLTFNNALLLTSIERMLGGSAKDINLGRAKELTAIELGFADRLARKVLDELQRALSIVGAATLTLGRIETDPDAAVIAKHSSLCTRMKFTISMVGQTGELDVIIPYDALETIRPNLGKIYFGDRGEDQSIWHDTIGTQIERANMDLEVVLAKEAFSIQKIMSWKPGSTINFGIEEGRDATMTCAEGPTFNVSVGKRNNGFVAVQITQELSPHKESEEDDNDN